MIRRLWQKEYTDLMAPLRNWKLQPLYRSRFGRSSHQGNEINDDLVSLHSIGQVLPGCAASSGDLAESVSGATVELRSVHEPDLTMTLFPFFLPYCSLQQSLRVYSALSELGDDFDAKSIETIEG